MLLNPDELFDAIQALYRIGSDRDNYAGVTTRLKYAVIIDKLGAEYRRITNDPDFTVSHISAQVRKIAEKDRLEYGE